MTLDQVVAQNLKRLRADRDWSRNKLASELSSASGSEWSEWRIIDLEGARTGHPPASARWAEIVALCLVFDVTIWELVLPVDPKERVRVITSNRHYELQGKPFTQQSVRDVGRSQLAERLSGFPARVFTKKGAAAARKILTEEGLILGEIVTRQEQIEELMNQLTEKDGEVFGKHS
jgi:hypothetical protein